MPQPIAIWNTARDAWEEPGGAMFCGHLAVFSGTFTTSGSMRSGAAYALPTWEPRTAGSGSSSSPDGAMLPTPVAQDAKNSSNPPAAHRRNTPPCGDHKLLPTPVAMEGYKATNAQDAEQKARSGQVLPTPSANLATKGGSQSPEKRKRGGHQVSLDDIAEHVLLPTPVAQPSGNSPEEHLRKKPGREVVTDLAIIAENGLIQTGGRLLGSSNVTLTDAIVRGRGMLPTPRATRGGSGTETMYALGAERSDEHRSQGDVLLQTPSVADGLGGHLTRSGDRSNEKLLPGQAKELATDWGAYEPAIRRWEQVLGRPAPPPTEPNKNGNHRLSPRFTEWMMGVPDGWICDVDLTPTRSASPYAGRNEKLKAAGNGVVPQQAAAALKDMLTALERTTP